jgi:cytoskeletal protein RodZ
MEPTTILVSVLVAGAFALLIWFEINSRQNEARMKQTVSHAQSESGPRKETESNVQSETEQKKAA